MDQAELRALEERCVQECAPWCTASCPAHVDVRGMMKAVAEEHTAEAAALLRKALPFPLAVALTCDEPCRRSCLRGRYGEPMATRSVERACLAAPAARRSGRRPPLRKGSVAVVGGGLTGLAAAVELAGKGFRVTLLEQGSRLGGRIWQELPVDATVVAAGVETPVVAAVEAELASATAGITVRLESALTDLAGLRALEEAHDALVLAPGAGRPDWLQPVLGAAEPDAVSGATATPGVFAGGSLTRPAAAWSSVSSVADGRRLAVSVQRHLEGVSLTAGRENESVYASCLHAEREGTPPASAVTPARPARGYSEVEARQEAGRCLHCECLECVKACVFLEHYKSYPRQYVRQINNSLILTPGMGYRASKTMIDSCTLCGLCAEVCPNDLDMGEVCLEARRELVERGYMPPAVHDFALHDMEQSNGETFACARHQPGKTASTYAFFPGCQLPASRPREVRAAYEHLAGRLQGGVGLLLGCCGAPAEWAGREELARGAAAQLRSSWEQLGRPRLVLACASCQRLLADRAPHIPAVSLWEVLDDIGLPLDCPASASEHVLPPGSATCDAAPSPARVAGAEQPSAVAAAGGEDLTLAVHDPCAARALPAVHAAARRLIRRAGFVTTDLDRSGALAECCGYGGLQTVANRRLTDAVVARRVAQDPHDYVAYCAMCRDLLARGGKRTWHLLDLLFGEPGSLDPALPGPRLTERQQTRARFKRDLLRDLWGASAKSGTAPSAEGGTMHLDISAELREKMESDLVSEAELAAVIEEAERSGRRFLDEASGHYLAHARPRVVTHWVEYSPLEQGGFAVHKAYSHRIEVLEARPAANGSPPPGGSGMPPAAPMQGSNGSAP